MKYNRKYILLIIISLILIGFSTNYFINWFKEKKQVEEITSVLKTIPKKDITTDDLPSYLVNPPQNKDDSYYEYIAEPFLEIDFTNLLKTNTDTVGWININNTTIDYPIVKTDNNNFYLNHSFDKSINKAGWIFADYRNNLDNLNKNTILYGHRRLDNIMFGSLINFLDEDWFLNKENHIIKISTPNSNMIWQIVSVYTILKESYYIKTNFNDESFKEFLETIKNRSIYDFNTSLDINDLILTLSTCYNNNGKRIVVHAKLIKKETR